MHEDSHASKQPSAAAEESTVNRVRSDRRPSHRRSDRVSPAVAQTHKRNGNDVPSAVGVGVRAAWQRTGLRSMVLVSASSSVSSEGKSTSSVVATPADIAASPEGRT